MQKKVIQPLLSIVFGLYCGASAAFANPGNLSGSPDAIAKAGTLIDAVGGYEVWGHSKSFTVKETAYLANGEVADLTIRRNLNDVTRWINLKAETFLYQEVIEADYGWSGRNGDHSPMSADELSDERKGLEQSPYYVYHRLAKGDPALRVEWIADARRLNVYEGKDRLLCWFILDDVGHPMSWVNIFKGRENRHNYGPLIDVGDASFPKWGAAADASWRFEYREAEFSADPFEMPRPVTE